MASIANPVMDIINAGGSRASTGLSQAARSAGLAAQSFNRGASLALKIDQVLENREARLNNQINQTATTMQNILNSQLNAAFKERQAKMNTLRFVENQRQFGINKSLQEEQLGLQKENLGLKKEQLDWAKKQKADELQMKKDALKYQQQLIGVPQSLGGTGKQQPAGSVVLDKKYLNSVPKDVARKNIDSRITILEQGIGQLKGTGQNATMLNNEVKRLKELRGFYSVNKTDAQKFATDLLDANPSMTEQEFLDKSQKYLNNKYFSKEDQSVLTSEFKNTFKKHKADMDKYQQAEYNIMSKSNADTNSDEYKVNQSISIIGSRNPALAKQLEGLDDKTSWWGNQSFLDSGFRGWADDEDLSQNILTAIRQDKKLLSKVPELKQLVKDVDAGKIDYDDLPGALSEVLKDPDIIRQAYQAK